MSDSVQDDLLVLPGRRDEAHGDFERAACARDTICGAEAAMKAIRRTIVRQQAYRVRSSGTGGRPHLL